MASLDFRTNSNNPNPRVACALLLDTSHSMGEPTVYGGPTAIDELNAGFAAFCDQIKTDDLAKKRAEIAVITFGGEAQIAIGFTEGRHLQPQIFKASGATPMGDVPEPFESAAERVRELEAANGVNVFAIGVGGYADFEQLSKLSDVRQPLRLKGLSFAEFFLWLSASMSAASTSGLTSGNGDGEGALALPPARWGEIAL